MRMSDENGNGTPRREVAVDISNPHVRVRDDDASLEEIVETTTDLLEEVEAAHERQKIDTDSGESYR